MKTANSMISRMEQVNALVRIIAQVGRKFFSYDGRVGSFRMIDNLPVWTDEYTGKDMMFIHNPKGIKNTPEIKNALKNTKDGEGFSHGSSLRCFLQDMTDYILLGNVFTYPAVPSGWGYDEDAMNEVNEMAENIGITLVGKHPFPGNIKLVSTYGRYYVVGTAANGYNIIVKGADTSKEYMTNCFKECLEKS